MYKQERYTVGVVIGRFQVDELHEGHREMLDWVRDNHKKMVVLLGISTQKNENNPLSFDDRKIMIQNEYPNAIILCVIDRKSDKDWSDVVDLILKGHVPPTGTVCLYGSRDGFIPYYSGKYPTQELEPKEGSWSGTIVREAIHHTTRDSADFRAGKIAASVDSYPSVVPTVDVAVFSGPECKSVYMVRKHGEKQIRFPGGYLEPGETTESCARREVREEVDPNLCLEGLRYIGNTPIDDWRYNGSRDRIHTTLLAAYRNWGSADRPIDTDEIAEVKEVTLTNLFLGYKTSVVSEHHVLVEMLKKAIEEAEENLENVFPKAVH